MSQVSAGLQHSCGLTDLGKASCWGSDVYGQLGNSVMAGLSPLAGEPNQYLVAAAHGVVGGYSYAKLEASPDIIHAAS
jgi:alpha-tubulin suppressor-like RCC1 family protein